MHRFVTNETTLVPNISNIVKEEDGIIRLTQEKIPILVLSDKFCEEQTFCYLLCKFANDDTSRYSSKFCPVL